MKWSRHSLGVVDAGSDLKAIMSLARNGSTQMSMERYARPKEPRLRAAAEAVAAQLSQVTKEEPRSAFVPQAVGAETERPASPEPVGAYGPQELASPRGFEPNTTEGYAGNGSGRVGDTPGTAQDSRSEADRKPGTDRDTSGT
ncbi:MAG: hypothetical protein ACYS9X_30570, partial [Planctomycetota bacterium]